MDPIDLTRVALHPGHLRAFSGRVTVGIVEETPLAIADPCSPPYAAPGLRCRFHFRDEASGEMVRDVEPRTPGYRDLILLQRGWWLPDRIVRESIFHRPLGKTPYCLALRQELIPLPDRAAVLIEIVCRDLRGARGALSIVPAIEIPALARRGAGHWTWFAPRFANAVREIGTWCFAGEGAYLRLRATAPVAHGGAVLRIDGMRESRVTFLLEFLAAEPDASAVLHAD